MATDLDRIKSPAAGKYDAIVASQLKQATTRIRLLDLTAGLLGLAALSLVYIVGMVLCDSKLLLSQHARQLSLYAFLAGAAVYLFFTVVRPLWLRVNPYYAARQVEQQLPQAKNSIVNWVDLHEQPLSPAIRGALGQRAAKDLSRVDLERAISSRRAAWMGGIAGLFAVVFAASFFLLGPAPFMSLLQRTFNPFEAVEVSTRTRLKLLKPEGGNATITVGRGINFAVDVGGKVPDAKAADAVKLLYRYEESDPWLERRLIQEPSGEWTASLSAIEVKNGFWYKITGGDAATEEYRVGVRAAAAVTDFLATYRFRTYVARADELHREREIKVLRGTEILLRVRTNRPLRDGRLELQSKGGTKTLAGKIDAEESHTFLSRFIVNEDGKYRLCFTSTDGEAYRDPVWHPVTAIVDQPPAVELTKPGQDIRLPADALLQLEGKAGDDIGVKSLLLQMRVIGGSKLQGQPYRSDEKLRLADGGYPRELEYKDFVELSRVKYENGQPAALRSGMELEYWLEARDACDYPQANVAESKHYRVLLTDPEKNDPKKDQDKKQADKEKKQHEQKQDQKLQKENQEREQQRQEQEARNKEEENKAQSGSQGSKGGDGEKSQQKEGEQANNGENKQSDGQQGDKKNGQGEANNGEQKSEQSKEEQSVEDRIKQALEKKDSGAKDKGDSGQGKEGSQDKPNGGGKSQDKNQSAGKQDTKQGSEGKEKGQPEAGVKPNQSDGKGDKSDPKSGDSKEQTGAGKTGQNKGKSKSAPQQDKGKSQGDSQTGKDDGQSKNKSAEGKEQQSKGEGKQKNGGGAEKNQGNSASKNERSGQGKSNPSSDANEKSANGEKRSDAGDSSRKPTPKEIEDLNRALKSKNPRQREKAKQELQRLAKEAADPTSRKKAGEALEKLDKPDGSTKEQTPKKGNDSSGKSKGEGKEKTQGDGAKDSGDSGDKDGGKKEKSGQENGQGDKSGRDSSSREELPKPQESQSGNTPGGGGDRRDDNDGGKPNVPPQPRQPSKPVDHRAAQMQLEDFAKKVNKDILKEAGVSEEQWKKYLEAKRKQLGPREKSLPEKASAPQQAKQLPSMGGKTIKPGASGKDDASASDRGQPLPGYRNAFREFTRQMSKDK